MILEQAYSLWLQFLALFPNSIRWLVSLVVFIFFVKIIIDLVKKSFFWLLLLILFVPASIPLIKEIFTSLFRFLQLILPSLF
ncbi:MAG: hypothetical protein PHX72_00125 [Candidatus Shapirobacteria bacterium]|nr:hypothetical protein [Candidatus Shapirobacteria bacterium]